MGVCCVEGCISKEDIAYFEFPTSRTLRRRWLEVIKIGNKVPLGTVVCSQHFNPEDYETVRGKVRLKRKVVPTLLLANKSLDTPPSEQLSNTSTSEPYKEIDRGHSEQAFASTNLDQNNRSDQLLQSLDLTPSELLSNTFTSISSKDICREDSERPHTETLASLCLDSNRSDTKEQLLKENPDSRPSEQLLESSKDIDRQDSKKPSSEAVLSPAFNSNSRRKKRSVKSTDICKVVVKESSRDLAFVEKDPELPDLKQPPDFEDMIINYQIKNKPNILRIDETNIGNADEFKRDDTIVVDDRGDLPPVFIEISVDKDKNQSNENSQDCLMVLESVQVEVDPSTLMLPEREYGESENDSDVEISTAAVPQKKPDPISLLTSSDEDDVIIQEPNIDTVEVSDETDEDDIPLVKLVKPKSRKRRKKKTKKDSENPVDVKSIVWNCGYDFYCVRCHFSTSDSVAYSSHLQEHEKGIHVCSICSFATSSKVQFARHYREKHHKEKRFKCNISEYRDSHSMPLMYNIESSTEKQVTSVRKGFKCIKCGYRSDYKGAVVKHLKVCSSKNKYPCSVCSYVTKRKHDLKRHWLNRHDDVVELDSDESYKPDWD